MQLNYESAAGGQCKIWTSDQFMANEIELNIIMANISQHQSIESNGQQILEFFPQI